MSRVYPWKSDDTSIIREALGYEHKVGLVRFSQVMWAPTFRYDMAGKRKTIIYWSLKMI